MSKVRANNKGFTLIELLASISILAIIMLMAIPNVVGIVQRNKNKTYVEDAKRFISLAKYEKSVHPITGTKTYYLKDLDKSKEIDEGPNGEKYNRNNSYVTIIKNSNIYNYKVTLYEEKNGRKIGIINKMESEININNVIS